MHRTPHTAPKCIDLCLGRIAKKSCEVRVSSVINHRRRHNKQCIATKIREGENRFGVSGRKVGLERRRVRCKARQRCTGNNDKLKWAIQCRLRHWRCLPEEGAERTLRDRSGEELPELFAGLPQVNYLTNRKCVRTVGQSGSCCLRVDLLEVRSPHTPNASGQRPRANGFPIATVASLRGSLQSDS